MKIYKITYKNQEGTKYERLFIRIKGKLKAVIIAHEEFSHPNIIEEKEVGEIND